MDKSEPISSSKAAEATLEKALKFLTEGWRANPTLYVAVNRAIGCLEGGDSNDQAHAQALKAYVGYPGNTAAQQAAYQLHAAILTAEGRRASGLPRRPRGPRYSPTDVSGTSELFKLMLAIEVDKKWKRATKKQGQARVRKASLAFDQIFGSLSLTTRAKVRKELNEKVRLNADFLNQFLEAEQNKIRMK